jgi:ATP-dependent Clp protease ATP-binding subunit ClpB
MHRWALNSIVRLQIARVEKRLADKQLGLRLTPAAEELLLERGYNPQYGARPLKRAIQKELETPLARCLLRRDFVEGDMVGAALSGPILPLLLAYSRG